jgi:acyl-CoA thioesterase
MTENTTDTAKDTAARSAAALWADDASARWFGFRIAAVGDGTATLVMDVQPHHCNGHGICHGGVIFTLADSAFAYACNSRNQRTVAQQNTITYIRPGCSGDVLTAEAQEVSSHGRSGVYDVRVTNQSNTTIAEFRGLSRAIGGHLFDE